MVRSETLQDRPPLLPVPDGVVELSGPAPGGFPQDGSIVELKDGSLMLAQGAGCIDTEYHAPMYRISGDGGLSWIDPQPLNIEVGVAGMLRLQSGPLLAYGTDARDRKTYFCTSNDEGKTWSHRKLIPAYQDFNVFLHAMTQLSSGRLLLVGYWEGLDVFAADLQRITQGGSGLWRGGVLFCEGHRSPEMGICLSYISDDEGETWTQCKGGLFGWFNSEGDPDGTGGITDIYEPTAVETNDGRLLMFARSKRGRLVQAYSLDYGATWLSVQPTELSSSQSPPMLVKIPDTGDLLNIWNQVSGEEIRRGFHRSRLSVAMSRDNGLTWENFKTIEAMQGLADVSRVEPEWPISANLRGRPGLGQIPDTLVMFDYTNVDIVRDKVFVRYTRMWPKEKDSTSENKAPAHVADNPMFPKYEDATVTWTGEHVLRIYPIEWFYSP